MMAILLVSLSYFRFIHLTEISSILVQDVYYNFLDISDFLREGIAFTTMLWLRDYLSIVLCCVYTSEDVLCGFHLYLAVSDSFFTGLLCHCLKGI